MPDPPGADADGCVDHAAALSPPRARTAPRQVLIEDWCQQYPSHSIGALELRPRRRALRQRAATAPSFNFADYGQDGNPVNPCGDPPGGVGATLTPPTAEGGALRAPGLPAPGGRSGRARRRDPARRPGHRRRAARTTRRPATPTPNRRRIIAYGFRNPFRFTFRPGTSEIWVGDVGWNTWEEINRIPDRRRSVHNFGWPCYEGAARQGAYDSARTSTSARRSTPQGAARRAPYFAYNHGDNGRPATTAARPARRRSPASRSTPAPASRPPTTDALFFADYARNCIWVDAQRRQRPARPDDRAGRSRPAPPARSTSQRARTAPSTTSTSTAGRSAGSPTRPATARRPRAIDRHPDPARRR